MSRNLYMEQFGYGIYVEVPKAVNSMNRIFGGKVVKRAWMQKSDFDWLNKNSPKRLKFDEVEFDISLGKFVVEFSSGKLVEIETTEDAWFKPVKEVNTGDKQ
jgi:hypothetical protein